MFCMVFFYSGQQCCGSGHHPDAEPGSIFALWFGSGSCTSSKWCKSTNTGLFWASKPPLRASTTLHGSILSHLSSQRSISPRGIIRESKVCKIRQQYRSYEIIGDFPAKYFSLPTWIDVVLALANPFEYFLRRVGRPRRKRCLPKNSHISRNFRRVPVRQLREITESNPNRSLDVLQC